MTPREPMIAIEGLNKWFGEHHVLRDIDLVVGRGEKVVVCGPSGSGKSTMIRCINRLESYKRGTIRIDGELLTNDVKQIERVRLQVGMVFQHFNLFPHLTILDNLTLGPIWAAGVPKKEATERAMEYLERVHIAQFAHRYPGELSGGQQQKGRDRPQPVLAAQGHALRRADLRARSRDGEGGAGRHDRARRGRYDHDRGHARDGVCARRSRHRVLHGRRADFGVGASGRILRRAEKREDPGVPVADSLLTSQTGGIAVAKERP